MTSDSVIERVRLLNGDLPIVAEEADENFDSEHLKEFLVKAHQVPKLFDYQQELSAEIVKQIRNIESGFVSLPTGAGKTRTAINALIVTFSQTEKQHVIWIAPTIELLDQAQKTFIELWNQFGAAPSVQLSRNGNISASHAVWFATPQLVNSRISRLSNSWDGVIFDEAHQMQAETYQSAVQKIKEKNKIFVIGLSATPGRSNLDEISELANLFNNKLIISKSLGSRPVKVLQSRGILSYLDFKFLSPANSDEARLKSVYMLCQRLLSEDKKILVFMRTLKDAEALSIALKQKRLNAWFVEGANSDSSRASRINAFAKCKSGVLVNQKLLTTGYDCPSISDVVLGFKVGSPISFEQMVGRAARGPLTGGEKKSTIWQFDDHKLLHGEPRAHVRFLGGNWKIVEKED